MTPEEFIDLVEEIYDAPNTGGAPSAELYFRAIYIGYEYPNLNPPEGDENAIDGYELGLKLRAEYHKKFK